MKIAVVGLNLYGHVSPLLNICKQLEQAGHTFRFVTVGRVMRVEENMEVVSLGTPKELEEIGEINRHISSNRMSISKPIQFMRKITQILLRELGKALTDVDTDAVLCDEMIKLPVLAVVEAIGNLPLALMSVVTLQHHDKFVPMFTTSWPPANTNRILQVVNQQAFFCANLMMRRILADVNQYREAKSLPLTSFHERTPSKSIRIHIVQMPNFLDFPRSFFPDYMFYTTSWTASRPTDDGKDEDFMSNLDGRPVLLFSMGTLSNHNMEVFRNTAKAYLDFPQFQLVMSLGKRGETPPDDFHIPPGAILRDFVPQQALLRKGTAVFITAGGLNSTLEALNEGVPLIVIPMNSEQPGNAARVERLGACVMVSKPSVRNMKRAIAAVSSNEKYRNAALDCQRKLRTGPTFSQTVELLEAALMGNERLTRSSQTARDIFGTFGSPL